MALGEQDRGNQTESLPAEGRGFRLTAERILLDQHISSIRVGFSLERLPTLVFDGQVLDGVTCDNTSDKLAAMKEQARQLRGLPIRERIHEVVSIVRENLQYAFPEVLEELAATNPDLAERIEANIKGRESLSDVIDTGHGICRHFSLSALVLGHEAGLEVSHVVNAWESPEESSIRNVVRRDRKGDEPLFRNDPVGKPLGGGHAWTEVKDGEDWTPMDASKALIGDTEEGLETFRDAHFTANILVNPPQGYPGLITVDGLPEGLSAYMVYGSASFDTSLSTSSGSFRIGLEGDRFSGSVVTKYDGPLSVTIRTEQCSTGLRARLQSVSSLSPVRVFSPNISPIL